MSMTANWVVTEYILQFCGKEYDCHLCGKNKECWTGLCCVPGVGLSLSRVSRVGSLSSLPALSSSSSPPPSKLHAFIARHWETINSIGRYRQQLESWHWQG